MTPRDPSGFWEVSVRPRPATHPYTYIAIELRPGEWVAPGPLRVADPLRQVRGVLDVDGGGATACYVSAVDRWFKLLLDCGGRPERLS